MLRPYTFPSCKVSVYDLGISLSSSKINSYNIVHTSLLLAALSHGPALLYVNRPVAISTVFWTGEFAISVVLEWEVTAHDIQGWRERVERSQAGCWDGRVGTVLKLTSPGNQPTTFSLTQCSVWLSWEGSLGRKVGKKFPTSDNVKELCVCMYIPSEIWLGITFRCICFRN